MNVRPLRILLVADYDDDPRLGSAKVVHKLREELRAAGHHCDALFADALGRAPAGRQVRQLLAPVMAARAVASRMAGYDVLDIASAEGLWVSVGRRVGRRSPAVICRSNGLEHLNYARMIGDSREGLTRKPWTRRIWYPLSRLSQVAGAARFADRMIVLNDGDRSFVVGRGWQPAERVHVVRHGVSDTFLDTRPLSPDRPATALFCGAWDHVKGVAYLARAFDDLAARGCPVPLTVLGPGVPAEAVLAMFAVRTQPHVTVIDRVPEADVIAAYRRHGILVFPSTYEGFGLVALEAMSQGLAVVATPVGCVPDLIQDGVTGLVVPPRDARALAAAVARLAADGEGRRRIGAAAAAAVSGLTWKRTAAETVSVYRRALGAAA